MMRKIMDKKAKDLDLRASHDGDRERLESMISSKMKGEIVQVKDE